MGRSRSKNAALNIFIGFLSQIGILSLSFVGRRIFLHFLAIDYLGINGLYSNIISVLSLAELGLGNVIQFFLYKPVAENDKNKIRSLMRFFGKIYFGVAMLVLIIGLLLIPFLGYIVNANLSNSELIVYYVIFLLNSVASYFGASKIALLSANQDNRLYKFLTLLMNVMLQISYIVILFVWRNYIAYVSAMLVCTIITQISLSVICNKRYPYLCNKGPDIFIDKKSITSNVKATFFYKVGATIVNNTDNILISVIVNTAAVGLYSNYCMVVNAIQGFITIITTSLVSGIGNLSAEGNRKRMLDVFFYMLLFYNFVAVFGSVSFFFLFNDLITFWLGSELLLDSRTVFAIAFAFYLTNAISPIWMFREVNGLFAKVKYLFLCTAACNIVLSIALGHYWGTFGILLATSISRIATQVWYEPTILFNTVFDVQQKIYWKKQFKYLILAIICCMLCLGIDHYLSHTILMLFVKAISFFVVSLIVFYVGVRKTSEYTEIKTLAKALINRNS